MVRSAAPAGIHPVYSPDGQWIYAGAGNEIVRMPAMRGDAVDGDARAAELRPADATMRAHAAAGVVMIHHALADRRFALGDTGAARDYHAARLVARNKGVCRIAQA